MTSTERWWLVQDGIVTEIDHEDLNAWPYVLGDDDTTGGDALANALYDGEAVVAYANTPEEALRLACQYDAGYIEEGKVYCNVCGHAHAALRDTQAS